MSAIRLAMIGCGGNSAAHAKRMNANPDVLIVGACDVSTEIAEGYVQSNLADLDPPPAAFDDIGQMLAEVTPDAVLISTPHTLHFEQGMQALEAGCHVFMEKPMVTDVEDARTIARKVEETGKVFVVGYNTACSGKLWYVRDCIRNKTLGNLELVTGYITQDWLRLTAGAWRQQVALSGGGQAYDSGAHLLNSLCWSLESNVSAVNCFLDNHGTEVDINSTISIRFESGVLAGMVVSGNCPSPGGTHMAFIFDDGRIELDGWSASWIRVWKGAEPVADLSLIDQMDAGTPDDNFIDAVLGRAEPRTSARNGIIQCQLMDAIYESARSGQVARP